MPINMLTGKKYDIDYQKMKYELMEMNIFHNKTTQQMYVDKWIATLMKADEDSVNSYFNPHNQELILKEKLEAPETFQTLVKMNSNDIYIHFRVSRIIQILKKCGITESDALEIEISEFKAHKIINWTETDAIVNREDPIIVVPFTIGRTYKELVIDGNHRLSSAIKENKESVRAYYVMPEFLVGNNLFSTTFDLLMYVFQNEVVWMGSFYNGNNDSKESILITDSYLICGKVNVSS